MYSFEPKRVDSAIRFTHLIIQEAKVCLRLLRIRNLQLFERRLGILLGSIHNHETDLEELVSYASDNVEKALISDLHNIAKGSNILLRLYRQYNTLAEHTQQAERFLRLLIALERRLDGLFKRFKKEIPEEGEVFFAGIDGGGTKTSAVVNDGTKNLGEEREGPMFSAKSGRRCGSKQHHALFGRSLLQIKFGF